MSVRISSASSCAPTTVPRAFTGCCSALTPVVAGRRLGKRPRRTRRRRRRASWGGGAERAPRCRAPPWTKRWGGRARRARRIVGRGQRGLQRPMAASGATSASTRTSGREARGCDLSHGAAAAMAAAFASSSSPGTRLANSLALVPCGASSSANTTGAALCSRPARRRGRGRARAAFVVGARPGRGGAGATKSGTHNPRAPCFTQRPTSTRSARESRPGPGEAKSGPVTRPSAPGSTPSRRAPARDGAHATSGPDC